MDDTGAGGGETNVEKDVTWRADPTARVIPHHSFGTTRSSRYNPSNGSSNASNPSVMRLTGDIPGLTCVQVQTASEAHHVLQVGRRRRIHHALCRRKHPARHDKAFLHRLTGAMDAPATATARTLLRRSHAVVVLTVRYVCPAAPPALF